MGGGCDAPIPDVVTTPWSILDPTWSSLDRSGAFASRRLVYARGNLWSLVALGLFISWSLAVDRGGLRPQCSRAPSCSYIADASSPYPPLYGLGGGRSGGVGLVALVVLGDDVPRLVEVVLSQGW